jgi:hypothetical protein
MRKILIAAIAASVVGVAGADAANQELGPQQYQDQTREQPQARAYLSYNFGGDNHRRGLAAPLHYGLRFDYDGRLRQQDAGVVTTPLMQFDHDNRGESVALAGGVPFAAHNLRMNQDGDGSGSSSSGGSSEGGWTFFDWTLLAVGVGGAGYLIYEATKGHNSPNAQPASSSSSGGGGLLGTGLLGYAEFPSAGYGETRDFEQQRWLDGGTGQMGDLGGK